MCMEPIRLACVRYLNTVPLIAGLERLTEAELVMAAPSHIAGLVASGAADVGLVSVADLSRQSDPPLAVVPAGMIGCDGPTFTVRLYSSVPFNEVRRVHIDTESHTSSVLCRLLLKELHGVDTEEIAFDAREHATEGGDWPDTVLMIGDKVVTSRPPEGRYAFEMDLGEAWKELTGLPFVYAVWACRAGEADAQRTATAAAVLDRQRSHNRTRIDWVVTEHASKFGWPVDEARRYLGELLRYRFDARSREGMERFLSMASAAGMLPEWSPVYAQEPARV